MAEPNQYGFRSGHSAACAALELLSRIISALDQNKIPISIFLSKAFDDLDHENIFFLNLKHYGNFGELLKHIYKT